MFGKLELGVRTNATADELWTRWTELSVMLDDLGFTVSVVEDQWKEAADPVLRDRMWTAYLDVTREYRVLASWRDVFFAAYVFATDGAECAALSRPSVG